MENNHWTVLFLPWAGKAASAGAALGFWWTVLSTAIGGRHFVWGPFAEHWFLCIATVAFMSLLGAMICCGVWGFFCSARQLWQIWLSK